MDPPGRWSQVHLRLPQPYRGDMHTPKQLQEMYLFCTVQCLFQLHLPAGSWFVESVKSWSLLSGSASLIILYILWAIDSLSLFPGTENIFRNCFDLTSFDKGHRRFPDPPDSRITFIVFYFLSCCMRITGCLSTINTYWKSGSLSIPSATIYDRP